MRLDNGHSGRLRERPFSITSCTSRFVAAVDQDHRTVVVRLPTDQLPMLLPKKSAGEVAPAIRSAPGRPKSIQPKLKPSCISCQFAACSESRPICFSTAGQASRGLARAWTGLPNA